MVVVFVGLVEAVCHVKVSTNGCIVVVLVIVGCVVLVIGGVVGEVGVLALKVVSEVGWLVNVVVCVEDSLVVVECGVVGIVAGE